MPAVPVQVLHALPIPNRLRRVKARLGHHHEPDIVGLGLHLARHGQAEEVALYEAPARDAPEGEEGEPGERADEEEEASREEVGGAGRGHALGAVGGDGVGDLVAEDGGEGVSVAADAEDATVDEEVAAGSYEGVGRACGDGVSCSPRVLMRG
jgi:hypothetical protein